ncbi:MAG: hypothetical protein E3J72_14280 [Planctomycetota bacterium]|nr:MAG: hypothetical protein E3J72_14280 [Planctomycetota bacterium]
MKPNRFRNFMRRWLRALMRVRLGLCVLLLVALIGAWALVFRSGTPRFDARIDVELLGPERKHYLETTIPLLLSRIQTPDRLLAYANLLEPPDRESYDEEFALGAEDFERFKKRIRFGMEGDSRFWVSYIASDAKVAVRVLQGVWGELKAQADAIDDRNTPAESKVLSARLESKMQSMEALERKVVDKLMIAEPRTVPPRMRTPEDLEAEISALDKAINLAEVAHAEVKGVLSFRQQQIFKIVEKRILCEEVKVVSPTIERVQERIGELKAQLAELKVDASDLHPLVLELRSTIEQLERSKIEFSGEPHFSKEMTIRPNPEHAELQSEINRLEGARVRLRDKINYYTSRRAMLRSLLDKNDSLVQEYKKDAPERERLREEIAELRVKARAAEAQDEVDAKHRARLDVDNSKLLILRRSLAEIYGIPFAWAIALVAAIGIALSMVMALADTSVRNTEDVSDIEIPVLGSVGEVGWAFRNLRDWALVAALLVLLGAYAVILVIREGGSDASGVVEAVRKSGERIKLTIIPTAPGEKKPAEKTPKEKAEEEPGRGPVAPDVKPPPEVEKDERPLDKPRDVRYKKREPGPPARETDAGDYLPDYGDE